MATPNLIRSLAQPVLLAAAIALCPLSAWAQDGDDVFSADRVELPESLQHVITVSLDYPDTPRRSEMTLAQVLASVQPAEQADLADVTPPRALPQQAQQYIAKADEQIDRGEFFAAVRTLRKAEAISPEHHAVLRGLGMAYTLSGNRVRGAAYLERAIKQQPDDLAALFLLAKFNASRGVLPATLAYARELPVADPASALMALTRYEALKQAGYTLAASESLMHCLDRLAKAGVQPGEAEDGPAIEPLIRLELAVLSAIVPDLQVQLADLYLSLDQYEQAEQTLTKLDPDTVSDASSLYSRLVYLALCRGKLDLALQYATEQLVRMETGEAGRTVVGYLLDQRVEQERIGKAIEQKIQTGSISLPLLTGLAEIAEPGDARQRAVAWLESGPKTPEVYREVAGLSVYRDDSLEDAAALAELLGAALNEMRRNPGEARAYVEAVLSPIDAPICLLRAMKQPALAIEDAGDAQAALLRAIVFEKTGRVAQATASYTRVLAQQQGTAASIRVPLAKLLIQQGAVGEAIRTLDPIGMTPQWEVFEVMMLALAENGQPSQAIQFVDNWRRTHGADTPSALLRAELVAMAGSPSRACNDIFRLIDQSPTDLRIYEAGLELVDKYSSRFSSFNLAENKRVGIVNRLQANLPDAPRSRIESAIEIYRQQTQQPNPQSVQLAIELLRSVINDDPKNARAWINLHHIYQVEEEFELAEQAFDGWLKAEPATLSRIILGAEIAVLNGEMRRASAMIREVLVLEQEDVLPGGQMDEVLAGRIISLLSAAEPDADDEALSLRMLMRFPNSVQLNNSLGYQWTVQGKNLLQAKAMIERALKNGGPNYAVLDSMAWVQYKLGEFEAAVKSQTRALQELDNEKQRTGQTYAPSVAVLNDHMGDIMYRSGDTNAANRHWQVARGVRLDEEDLMRDPELRSLATRVDNKLVAVQEGKEPPVTPIPGLEAHGPAGHPADAKQGGEAVDPAP